MSILLSAREPWSADGGGEAAAAQALLRRRPPLLSPPRPDPNSPQPSNHARRRLHPRLLRSRPLPRHRSGRARTVERVRVGGKRTKALLSALATMALRQLGRGLVMRAKEALPVRGGGGGPIKYAPELRQTVSSGLGSLSPLAPPFLLFLPPLLPAHTHTPLHTNNKRTDAPVGRAVVGRRPVLPASDARRRRRQPFAHARVVVEAVGRRPCWRGRDDLGRACRVVSREGTLCAAAVPAGGARGGHVARQSAVVAGAVRSGGRRAGAALSGGALPALSSSATRTNAVSD